MVDFNASLSENITSQQRKVIGEVLEYYSSVLTDKVTVNLSFTNTNQLDDGVKGGAVSRTIGGLNDDQISFDLQENFLQPGAKENVITFDEFKSALAADATSTTDNKFVQSIDDGIIGSAVAVSKDIQGIQLTSANAKAVGLEFASASALDGEIAINNFNQLSDSQFKVLMMHEVGHVIGFTSAVDFMTPELARFSATSGLDGYKFIDDVSARYATEELYRVNPLDLGRYAERQYGDIERSFFSSGSNGNFGDVFFSIDGGKTKVSDFALGKHFNTESNVIEGQYFYQGSHWSNDLNDGGIMDAAFQNIQNRSSLSNDDLVALDAIGWNVSYTASGSGKVVFTNFSDIDNADYEDALEARNRRVLRAGSRTRRQRHLRSEDIVSVDSAINSYEDFLDDLRIQKANANNNLVRIEAEDYDSVRNYKTGYMGNASGKYGLHLAGGAKNQTGVANYTFDGTSGTYNLSLGLFDETDGNSSFLIKVNGELVGQKVYLNQDLGYNHPHQNTHISRTLAFDVSLEQGDLISVVGKENKGEFARFDYIDFSPVAESLSTSSSWKVEAEDYVDYWDRWSGNDFGEYRNDDVDIEVGGTGYNVGQIDSGEYLTYDVSMTAGTYNVLLRVASGSDELKAVDVTVDGQTYISPSFGHTGDWQGYTDIIVNDVSFTGSSQSLRLDFPDSGLNLDYIEII